MVLSNLSITTTEDLQATASLLWTGHDAVGGRLSGTKAIHLRDLSRDVLYQMLQVLGDTVELPAKISLALTSKKLAVVAVATSVRYPATQILYTVSRKEVLDLDHYLEYMKLSEATLERLAGCSLQVLRALL
jgi:hypothetical protein